MATRQNDDLLNRLEAAEARLAAVTPIVEVVAALDKWMFGLPIMPEDNGAAILGAFGDFRRAFERIAGENFETVRATDYEQPASTISLICEVCQQPRGHVDWDYRGERCYGCGGCPMPNRDMATWPTLSQSIHRHV